MQRAPGRWRGTSCLAPQLPGHRAVVLDRSKRWAGRFLARQRRRCMLLRNMAATCRAYDPSKKIAVSGYMRKRGGPAGLRPAPAEAEARATATATARRLSVGCRGGSGCGGRCKYIPVSSVAPSMALTPPQPDPPRLRQIPDAVGRCRPWSTPGSTPCVDEIQFHSMISKSVGTSIHARRGCARSRETVRGGAVWVGRTVGAMDGAIEPPWMGLRRVLPAHTAAPSSVARCCRCFGRCLCRCRAQPGRSPSLMLRRRMHWAKFPWST